jgi:hypothetical protein
VAFSDLALSDLDGVLALGEASDSVTYYRHNGEELSINAVVEKLPAEGVTDLAGPDPIQVIVSRTDVATWKKHDRIRWNGSLYRIKDEISVDLDAAAWVFYCAANS